MIQVLILKIIEIIAKQIVCFFFLRIIILKLKRFAQILNKLDHYCDI